MALIGYLGGYKETKKVDGGASITFRRIITKTYPKKYENKKDFWAIPIYEGEYELIYMTEKRFRESLIDGIVDLEEEDIVEDYKHYSDNNGYDFTKEEVEVGCALIDGFMADRLSGVSMWGYEKIAKDILGEHQYYRAEVEFGKMLEEKYNEEIAKDIFN